MNKIVKNKRYDTETATLICSHDCISGKRGDGYHSFFRHWFDCSLDMKAYVSATEYIYKKQNGEYFLYHQPTGKNGFDREEEIIPLIEEQALDYCQKWMTGDEYEKIFGKVDE